ncbi:MAG TPA: beta-galactosidase [Candidatus Tetragenococcus pullicola]|nr:beta-galactosidase [Candidatus Tetragenococcus pullicola]
METFEIKEDFLLNKKPFKIISGAIHYFRLPVSQWEDSLYNLKALGANTVETYIPWNLHEPKEGTFDFSGNKDLVSFVNMAKEIGLYVILRPCVYICAEWEFGGLPAWLLKIPGLRLRSTDPVFMEKVSHYYEYLLPKLKPLQLTEGGPVLMMQVENEYGSYGMEKEYLRQTKNILIEGGITVPLFTSDGAWKEVLDAGSLIDDDVFLAGNFGSHAKENSQVLREFMTEHGKKWPIMCMEFWDGWFNRWGQEVVTRDADELAKEVKEMLEIGSINLYMFHGGTNFGFYNGCSARGQTDLPQVTSYDYGALLTEAGEPTAQYYAVQKAIKEVCPDVWQAKPRYPQLKNLGKHEVLESVSLFQTVDKMTSKRESVYPLTMETAGSGYGYMLYQVSLKNYRRENKLKVIEASDRVSFYMNKEWLTTQYQEELGQEILIDGNLTENCLQLDLLVENLGRVNYGYKLNNPSQSKGIRNGIMYDIHFVQGYQQYALDFSKEQLAGIDFSKKADPQTPSLYRFQFDLAEVSNSYIDCSEYGKGIILVNGFHLGRYWKKGPHGSLYCPKDFLKNGTNEVIIFETEGIPINQLCFSEKPIYSALEK